MLLVTSYKSGIMQLHNVQPAHRSRRSNRIGRGGKRGTYSGRGMKGQKARGKNTIRPAIRDYIKRIPKLRGEEFPATAPSKRPELFDLDDIRKHYQPGTTVSPRTLASSGLLSSPKTSVKLLGTGSPPEKLLLRGIMVSKSARKKIEEAGGKVEN